MIGGRAIGARLRRRGRWRLHTARGASAAVEGIVVATALLSLACGGGGADATRAGDSATPSERRSGEAFFEIAQGEQTPSFTHRNGMNGEHYFVEMMGAGVALFDADGDGDLDAYLCQGKALGPGSEAASPLGGRLFMNGLGATPGSLTWTDRTEAAGLSALEYGTGVAVGDIDNDGDLDLYLSNFGPNQLYRNDGQGLFELVVGAGGAADGRWSASAAFFDYDRDGWLDLYVTNYVDFTLERPKVCSGPSGRPDYCSPNSYRGEPDSLFHNRGDGTFEDVTVVSGIASKYGNGLGVIASDLDRDGWIDLYVANDLEENILWRNQGDGTFVNEAMLFGVGVNSEGKAEAGMGLVAADFDNDGDEDLFLTHLVGETNTFYENQEGRLFLDRTQRRGLSMPSVAMTGFGVVAVDVDNDSLLDLVVANGAVTVVEELALAGDDFPLSMPNQLFMQDEEGRFVESLLAKDEPRRVSRGIAAGDVDNDGDTDLLMLNNHGPAELLINRTGQNSPWIGFRLLQRTPTGVARDAYGATISLLSTGGDTQFRVTRRVAVEGGYLASHDPRVVFGLRRLLPSGQAKGEVRVSVEVCWRGSECEVFDGLAAQTYHELREGGGSVREISS